jgi:8-oxo-dGTP pyrophosphatase MutT (NUDIX family)
MGGGILPITFYNRQVWMLFGKERDTDIHPGWSDFGGGSEKDEPPIETAAREASEELVGFLGDAASLRALLSRRHLVMDLVSPDHGLYRTHIAYIPYDPSLPGYFNRHQSFLKTKMSAQVLSTSKLFEKQEIRWFTLDEVENKRDSFRSFYQLLVKLLLENRVGLTRYATSVHTHIRTREYNEKKTRRRRHHKRHRDRDESLDDSV